MFWFNSLFGSSSHSYLNTRTSGSARCLDMKKTGEIWMRSMNRLRHKTFGDKHNVKLNKRDERNLACTFGCQLLCAHHQPIKFIHNERENKFTTNCRKINSSAFTFGERVHAFIQRGRNINKMSIKRFIYEPRKSRFQSMLLASCFLF